MATNNEKERQLDEFRFNPLDPKAKITTNFGVNINHTDDSLKAGARGPTLLEDFHFREKIMHFDHERIPERVVHARGAGAHGYFELYKSQTDITKAGFLTDTTRKTPVFVRFSTVLGSRGSADTVRDVRGFATRFYTQEGNFDLVGNNIPVFFIQDAIKFPDVIHAGKPEPDCEMPQAQTAHNNFWDFISLMPESMHMVMWVLSDRAIPRSYRMMEGFGVHSFVLVNEAGERRFVKFHWRPKLGTYGLVWDEALKISGQDPDFHRRDLYEAIESGNYPEYELGLQIVDEKDEHKFDFDLLDATKIIPEELVPLRIVGKMTLNRNPTEFFTETEQIAFCTNNIVPGIDFSNDPLLQGRNFSYVDTQLLRLGGPNFNDLPINRPICPVINNQRDGHMRYPIATGKVNYFPNRFGCPHLSSAAEGGFVSYAEKIQGMKERARGPKFQERYNQATLFWNSLTDVERDHLVAAACFELGKTDDPNTQKRMLEHFVKIEPALARRVADGLGLDAPAPEPGWKNHGMKSRPLSMVDPNVKGIATRKVAILVADGCDSKQVNELKGALKAAGAVPALVAPRRNAVKASDGTSFTPDFALFNVRSTLFDATFIPGGAASAQTLSKNGDVISWINESYKHFKVVGATAEGISVLQKCILPGVTFATGDAVVSSHGVVTGQTVLGGLGTAAAQVVGGTVAGAAAGAVSAAGGEVGGVVGKFIEEASNGRYWARDVSMVPA